MKTKIRRNGDQSPVPYTQKQNYPYLLYYGTEKGMTHKGNRFCGEPYADEQVRACMEWDKLLIF